MTQKPIAKKILFEKNIHDQKLIDNYHWLRDEKWPDVVREDVLNYLKEENNYFDEMMKKDQEIIDQIFNELKGRIKEDDETYPIKEDNYYYYARIEKGQNHWIMCRKKDSVNNPEEIILDTNILAGDHKAFALGGSAISPDHNLLAYSFDNDGSEKYTIRVKDLSTGLLFEDEITDVIGSIIWHENGKGFYYTPVDENWRTNKVFYHILGTNQKEDILVFKEQDPTFNVGVSKTTSKRFIVISIGSGNSNEEWLIDLTIDHLKPILFKERQNDYLYDLDHHQNEFYILTNDLGKNFRLVKTADNNFDQENWQEVIAHNKDIYLTDFALYQAGLVVTFKEQGLSRIEIYDYKSHNKKEIRFPESTYDLSFDDTEYESDFLRIYYSSLTLPTSVMEYSFAEDKIYTRKTQEVLGGFDPKNYTSERLHAKSHDGVMVPISLVYNKNLFAKDSKCLLYGYGSYGISTDPYFRTNIISLLDRGYVFAIAHIRGGDDLSYNWYEDAKFLKKKNTFQDFIACSEHLIKHNYTTSEKLGIMGGSAGGMLMGVVCNERPDLYKSVISMVPFVDVLNTMLDEDLPLTPGEFKEWGNPKEKEYFDYIKSYSPYDNIKSQNYPHMLVTAGLTDPRVPYWEPSKYVAKLRTLKNDNNILLLKTEMSAGHQGETGRYDSLKEVAINYAFLIKTIG